MTNSVKFYWNGLRINGEKTLIKCSYSLNNHKEHKQCVTLYARDYSHLPRDLFVVENGTDYYTDYFDTDSATLTPDHPLYKYARYAAAKAEIRDLKHYVEYTEKNLETSAYYKRNRDYYENEIKTKREKIAELEAIENPGHPTDDDLMRIAELRLEAENARIAAEQERLLKRREEMLRQQNEGKAYIERIAAEHPIKEGEPVVTIDWSENPAFYHWDEGGLKLSVAAAEIILTHFDKEVHAEEDRGYDKTSFTIEFVNEEGELDTYKGRYDLGDDDGGLIEHIRSFGEFYSKKGSFGNGNPTEEDKELGEAIVAIADMLNKYTETAPKKFYMVEIVYWPELDFAKGNTFTAIGKVKPQATTVQDGNAMIHRVYFDDPVEAEDYRQRMMVNYRGGAEE